MSDLRNPPELQAETDLGQEASSPWSVLITTLLLIAGLLFASVLMMDYVRKTRAESGTPAPGFSELIEKAKAMAARVPSPAEDAEPDEASAPLADLKQIVSNAGSAEKVRWPRLKLSGFGTSPHGLDNFAIINGEQVRPGQIVDKVTVLEVRSRDVLVEYKGEQKTLTMDVND